LAPWQDFQVTNHPQGQEHCASGKGREMGREYACDGLLTPELGFSPSPSLSVRMTVPYDVRSFHRPTCLRTLSMLSGVTGWKGESSFQIK
jgi:hypothetical protein